MIIHIVPKPLILDEYDQCGNLYDLLLPKMSEACVSWTANFRPGVDWVVVF